jgi:hypothetical protein
LAYWRIGVLAYWRIGVLAYWRIGVLAYWRIGVLASLREPLAKNNRLSEVDQAIDQKSRKFFSRIRIF